MKSKEYRNEGLDFKRLALFFRKKIWIVFLMTVIGGIIGAISYQVVTSLNMPIEYQAVSKMYVKFNVDENGEVYQHYNGYTWNDLLDSDPIMECIMAYLPDYKRADVEKATQALIISDIRVLTVNITSTNEKTVREIQTAVESGLTTYAINDSELASIKTIKTEPPVRLYWKDKTIISFCIGALLFGFITLFIYLYGFITDDAVYVQSDLEKRFNYKALGIMPRSQKGLQPYLQELKANINTIVEDKKHLMIIDIDDHSELRAQDMERILNWNEGGQLDGAKDVAGDLVWHVKDEEDDDFFTIEKDKEWIIIPVNSENVDINKCEAIKKAGGALIMVPFGSPSAPRKLERIISLFKNQEMNIYGIIITEADEEYLNRYYG